VKKLRAVALIAVVTTAVRSAQDYARENPDSAGQAVDKVEDFLRGRLAPKHGAYLDKGSAALRQGLGLPAAGAGAGAGAGARAGAVPLSDLDLDPDPDAADQWAPHSFRDPVAPNPSPGTSDDPQPRRQDDDPAPLTPGERPRH